MQRVREALLLSYQIFFNVYCMTSYASCNVCSFISPAGRDVYMKYSVVFLRVPLNMHATLCFH